MVNKPLFYFLLLMLYTGCTSVQRNEKCIDETTFKTIDTAAFYLVDKDKHPEVFYYNIPKSANYGLKFYKNGKVRTFYDYPKILSAEGTYCINQDKAELKLFYKHPQGNFWSKEILEFNNDTIVIHTIPSAQTRGSTIRYIKKKL